MCYQWMTSDSVEFWKTLCEILKYNNFQSLFMTYLYMHTLIYWKWHYCYHLKKAHLQDQKQATDVTMGGIRCTHVMHDSISGWSDEQTESTLHIINRKLIETVPLMHSSNDNNPLNSFLMCNIYFRNFLNFVH